MTDFLLVRHATCDAVGVAIAGRAPGVSLNEQGRREAERVATRLAATQIDAISSSALARARETAEAIARPHALAVRDDDAFAEIDFGEWTGKSFEALSAGERWQRFNTNRSTTRIPGGESFLDVQARAVNELERLAARHADARVAIVSHADVIKTAIGYFAATPIDLLQRIEISPCSVSVIELNENGPRLLTVNNTDELTK